VPDFTGDDVVDWTVQRAPLVEPVHARGHAPRTAPIWPAIDGLGLASASQVYPRLLNGDSVVRLAEQVAGETSQRLGLPGTPTASAPLAAAA
jgi:protoporphyrinogen oxidase